MSSENNQSPNSNNTLLIFGLIAIAIVVFLALNKDFFSNRTPSPSPSPVAQTPDLGIEAVVKTNLLNRAEINFPVAESQTTVQKAPQYVSQFIPANANSVAVTDVLYENNKRGNLIKFSVNTSLNDAANLVYFNTPGIQKPSLQNYTWEALQYLDGYDNKRTEGQERGNLVHKIIEAQSSSYQLQIRLENFNPDAKLTQVEIKAIER